MSTYLATVSWERGGATFVDNDYSRGHNWTFDGGLTVPASASPDIVPLPLSVAENVDPEEAFVASLSSCHMLFFLSLAQGRGFTVDRYVDNATGELSKDGRGKTSMTRVVLRPEASYSGVKTPSRDDLERLHHKAHELCYIANSVRTDVVTEIVS